MWVNNRLIGYDFNDSYVFNESGQEIFLVNNANLFHNGPYSYYDLDGKYYDYNGIIIEDVKYFTPIDREWYNVTTTNGSSYLYNAQKNKKYEFEVYVYYNQSLEDGMIRGSVNGSPCYFNTETEKIIGPFNTTGILKPFNEGVAVIDERNNERIIDKNGKTLLHFRRAFPNTDIRYSFIGDFFSEGVLYCVKGYIYNPLTKEHSYQQTSGGKNFIANLELKAREAFKKKKYAEAQAILYQIYDIDNSKLWALSDYAACLINQGFNDEAIEVCEMVLSEEKNNKHALELKKLAERNIEVLSHQNDSNEFESVANHNSVWNVIESLGQTLMNITGQHIPQTYNSFKDSSNDNSQSFENFSSNNTDYQSQYDMWANRAESNYNSLTNLGYSYTNKSGQKKGGSGQGASPGKYTAMKRSLREAQREMRNIRQRARRAGVTISQSQWETASVNY